MKGERQYVHNSSRFQKITGFHRHHPPQSSTHERNQETTVSCGQGKEVKFNCEGEKPYEGRETESEMST